MIERLRGTLVERTEVRLVVEVGGVGYGLVVPESTLARLGDVGDEVLLWTHMYVREDALRLFGFATKRERETFEILIELPGIGPNLGLAILSSLTVPEIVQATLGHDVKLFTTVKGIGSKLAEKMILELRGRTNRLAAGLSSEERESATGGGGTPLKSDAARDAVAALEALDVRAAQARHAIAQALEALGEDAGVEELVREGLKHRR